MFLRFSLVLISVGVVAGCSASDSGADLGGTGSPAGGGSSTGSTSSNTGGGLHLSSGANGSKDAGVDGGEDCNGTLKVLYRDFKQQASSPDFEMGFKGDVPRRGLIEPLLGSDQKPVFKDSVGCPWDEASPTACSNWTVSSPVITSKATFDTWYHNTEGVNLAFEKTLVLTETKPGSGLYAYDSTDFFPLLPTEGFGITPGCEKNQNFHFTTEIHLKFGYVPRQVFSFSGDDDLWIFVNGRLALDLGSMHGATAAKIDFDVQAKALGISPGKTYTMDIFHAERHTDGSNFHVETNISCFTSRPVLLK